MTSIRKLKKRLVKSPILDNEKLRKVAISCFAITLQFPRKMKYSSNVEYQIFCGIKRSTNRSLRLFYKI